MIPRNDGLKNNFRSVEVHDKMLLETSIQSKMRAAKRLKVHIMPTQAFKCAARCL